MFSGYLPERFWLAIQDSNLGSQIQSLVSYH